jgi:GH15 family glucan-1,4-alpha-glucosidase
MSWVALDRGIRIATDLGLEGDIATWTVAREAVRADVLQRGWDPAMDSFAQAYGHPGTIDAALLAIGLVGFLPWDDPRIVGTVRAVQRLLTTPDGELVYRYRTPDGLDGEEGAFSICTFWLAESLLRIGDRAAAERIVHRMLRHANHVGLYSEEIDPVTGAFLGNFPQGFTHIALIHAAVALAG